MQLATDTISSSGTQDLNFSSKCTFSNHGSSRYSISGSFCKAFSELNTRKSDYYSFSNGRLYPSNAADMQKPLQLPNTMVLSGQESSRRRNTHGNVPLLPL